MVCSFRPGYKSRLHGERSTLETSGRHEHNYFGKVYLTWSAASGKDRRVCPQGENSTLETSGGLEHNYNLARFTVLGKVYLTWSTIYTLQARIEEFVHKVRVLH
jgi:hypothetical protein